MRRPSQISIIITLATLSLLGLANLRGKALLESNSFLRRLQASDEPINTVRKTTALNPVIVTLLTDTTSLVDLCSSLRTLKNAQGHPDAPILVFHLENAASDGRKAFFSTCTDRSIFFPTVDLDDFPEGFVPREGVDYTSAQINRFWTTKIWEHPALEPYDVIMRVDHDSCLSLPNAHLPSLKSPFENYHSHYFPGTVELNVNHLRGMFEFADKYMKDASSFPRIGEMWQKILYTHNTVGTLPTFQDSFEVSRKSFMLKDEVRQWHYALTDLPPYGYYTQGWNVDAERFLTLAMFGTRSSLNTDMVPGFVQKSLAIDRRHPGVCETPFM